MTRTAQQILAERRSVVMEQSRESDQTAKAVLQFQIDNLDRELDLVTNATPVESHRPGCQCVFCTTKGGPRARMRRARDDK